MAYLFTIGYQLPSEKARSYRIIDKWFTDNADSATEAISMFNRAHPNAEVVWVQRSEKMKEVIDV